MNKQQECFSWPIRVYYEDTDAGGIVYHSNYLRFMERARTEWLRARGFEQDVLRDEHGVIFVVHRIDIAYRRPARFNDELEVCVELIGQRKASLEFRQLIHRKGCLDEKFIEATVHVASVNAETLKPRGIPACVTERII